MTRDRESTTERRSQSRLPGLRFVPGEHDANQSDSSEEV